MSMNTIVYIGPYIEIKTDKPGKHCDELLGEESLFDCTDYLSGKPEGKRILIPNIDRGAPRDFWLRPNEFCGFETFSSEIQVLNEIGYLSEKFDAEFEKLRTYYSEPDIGSIRWGYFTFYM